MLRGKVWNKFQIVQRIKGLTFCVGQQKPEHTGWTGYIATILNSELA